MDCLMNKTKKKKRKNSEASQRLRSFQDNGEVLLQDLIELCNGKSNPIKTFSANQIIQATDNFNESNHLFRYEFIYKGTLDNRPVLIKRATWNLYTQDTLGKICRDIAVSSMVSGHKNFLKLLGCCLEFEYPVLVCEYAERLPCNNTPNLGVLIKMAKEIAIAVSYLHTAFPRTMVHTDIQPYNIFLDSNGTAKLSGFCLCVSIPEGETFVKVDADRVEGVLDYLEYKYVTSGVVTENTDVFSFGVLLQNLLIGKHGVVDRRKGDESVFEYEYGVRNLRISDRICKIVEEGRGFEIFDPQVLESVGDEHSDVNLRISDRVCKFVEEGRIFEILDPQMLEKMADDETGEQERRRVKAVIILSLRCTGHRGDVPNMMEVAKELKNIERWT